MKIKAGTVILFMFVPAFFMAAAETKAASYLSPSAIASNTQDSSKGKYLNGQKHGIWKTCNAKGQVIKKEKYKRGKLIYYIIFNEKHQIVETRDKNGVIRRYNPCNC